MHQAIYQQIVKQKANNKKSLAILIDPDKLNSKKFDATLQLIEDYGIDFIFYGGSLLTEPQAFENQLSLLKQNTSKPVIIFPGSNLQISKQADALLLLSLISGRNPEFLIGQHVIAAPYLKQSKIETIATGYMLIDSGNYTTAHYISNALPIPYNKPEIAVCTAIAGEMLGLKCIYLDGGSGATKTIHPETVSNVSNNISIPLIVGGGIDHSEKAKELFRAGADVLVIGNAVEKDPSLIAEISYARNV
jgi:putative glycerol-1-phosphate prenyltransferase